MALNSLASALLGVSILFPLLAIFATILRFAARKSRGAKYGPDDWMIVVTVVLCMALSANSIAAVALNLIGQAPQSLGIQGGSALNKVIYGDSFMCFSSLATVKIAVLLFYKRIFTTKRFRLAASIMMGVITVWWIASLVCLLISQIPIESHWEITVPYRATLNFQAFLLSHAALDLFLDIVILCFPLPVISSLHMKTGRKIALVGIFWLGAFCVVAEAVRIYYFTAFFEAGSKHFSDGVSEAFESSVANVLIWSRVEPCVSVVAACLPALGPLVRNGRDPASLVNSIRSIFSVHSDGSRGSGANNSSSNNIRLTEREPQAKGYSATSHSTEDDIGAPYPPFGSAAGVSASEARTQRDGGIRVEHSFSME